MKKVILISGGSDGLGKAAAQKFNEKYQVVILSSNPEKTETAAKEIGCDFVVADVTDYSQIEKAVEEVKGRYGRIDHLINNAGIWIEGKLEENEASDISKVLDVNTKGTIYLSKAVVPLMKEQGVGRIVNVISQAGLHVKGERSVYHASKWAITGFTDSLRMELAPFNISVCGYFPGAMKTDFFAKVGITKELHKHMELEEAVRALEFIIETPDSIIVPQLGIRPLNG